MKSLWLSGVLVAMLLGCATPAPAAHDASTALDSSTFDAEASSDAGPTPDAAPCHPAHAVALPPTGQPEYDSTQDFVDAMNAAAADPQDDLLQTDGSKQGRMYVPAGTFNLGMIYMVSNVRVEIEPGATIINHVVPVSNNGDTTDRNWGIFMFGPRNYGDPQTAVHHVTFTTGNGCGGAGTSTMLNKPNNTNFRGNSPTADSVQVGMANEVVPYDSYWPVADMYVIDLDTEPYGTVTTTGGTIVPKYGTGVAAFLLSWSYDVSIDHLFTIQNSERAPDGSHGLYMSQLAAIVPRPPFGSSMEDPIPAREDTEMPHRLNVDYHYNILSPSGYGNNQIQACLDCTFTNIFSHGGTPMRIETDGMHNSAGYDNCAGTGPLGAGFKDYGLVDNLTATNIEGVDGNFAVSLTPHCSPNGVVHVSNVIGTDMNVVVQVAPQNANNNGLIGYFDVGTSVTNVIGYGGTQAQQPEPQNPINSYSLGDANALLFFTKVTEATASGGTSGVTLNGSVCWPTGSADPLRLAQDSADFPIAANSHYTVTNADPCPGEFTTSAMTRTAPDRATPAK